MKLLFICCCLIVLTVNAVDPLPLPLPEKFTQSFTVSESTGQACSGKIFYDSTTLSQKVTLVGGDTDYFCGQDSCSAMLINGTGYFIFPEKNLCCYLDDITPSIPRDVLAQYYTYQKEIFIYGKKCYYWLTKPGQIDQFFVCTDTTPKRIMVAFAFEIMSQVTSLEFWDGSYSQKFSDKTVFQVPKYCNSKCQSPTISNNLLWKMTLGLMQRAEPKLSKIQNLIVEE